jgi:hypothetical protein
LLSEDFPEPFVLSKEAQMPSLNQPW